MRNFVFNHIMNSPGTRSLAPFLMSVVGHAACALGSFQSSLKSDL